MDTAVGIDYPEPIRQRIEKGKGFHATARVAGKQCYLCHTDHKGANFDLKRAGDNHCTVCHKELPAWDKIAPKLGGKVLFVAVNINTDEKEGRTFKGQMGRQVLPEFLSVIDDPTARAAAGHALNGFYLYDDEGVQARPVTRLYTSACVAKSRSNVEHASSPGYHG